MSKGRRTQRRQAEAAEQRVARVREEADAEIATVEAKLLALHESHAKLEEERELQRINRLRAAIGKVRSTICPDREDWLQALRLESTLPRDPAN